MQLYPELNKQGAIATVKNTISERGIFGIYRGYSALLLFSVPKNYTRFGAFTYAKQNIFTEPSRINNFACGLMAGAAEAVIVVTP
jgi:hypothetical protein